MQVTSGWLLSEVIRELDKKGILTSELSKKVPTSLSTYSMQFECIDLYLTRLDQPLQHFLQ